MHDVNSDTPQGQDNTAEGEGNRPNSGPAVVDVPPVPPTGPPPPGEHAQADDGKNPTPWWKKLDTYRFIAELAILLVTLRIACIYADQLKEMTKSNGISHDALVAGQRPWLSISPEKTFSVDKFEFIPNPVTPNGGQPTSLHAMVTFSLENFGNTPARRIAPAVFSVIPTDKPEVPEQWQKMGCTVGEQISKGGTVTTSVVMPKSSIQQSSESWGGVASNTQFHHVWMLGCFVYQDTLGGPFHHTRVILHSKYSPHQKPLFSIWDSDAD